MHALLRSVGAMSAVTDLSSLPALTSASPGTPTPSSAELLPDGAGSADHWASLTRVMAEKETFASEALAAEFLLVEVAAPRPSVRGRLGMLLDGAIERALEARGAPPPALVAGGDFDGALDDLLRRAEVSGTPGIALWIPSLASLVQAGVLDPMDSSTLRAWLRASRDRAVRVGFHCENLPFGVHLEPLPLAALLRPGIHETTSASTVAGSGADDGPTEAPAGDAEGEDRELAGERTDGASRTETRLELDETEGSSDATERVLRDGDELAESARSMARDLGDDEETGWLREALMELSTPPPRASLHAAPERRFQPAVPNHPVAHRLDLAFADPPIAAPADDAPAEPAPYAEPEPDPEPVHDAVPDLDMIRAMEAHCRELEAATGPKPLAVVERIFSSSYMPLRAALDRNPELPARFFEIAGEWSRSFEKSYTDAFDALRVRAKRPSLLADVPDLALRIARLHGARTTQLLMVDGMRYDLADRVHATLREQVGQRAACAERFLLWAALPTTTAAQVEMIGRGAAGLKDFTGDVQSDLVVARGRKASTIRRLKAGHRELLKLDIVEARLTEPGFDPSADFDPIADEAAQRIAAYFEGLQPRTLVMVFGDHGFVVSRKSGAAELRHGGASPEEVLVPAFAWLVGAMH